MFTGRASRRVALAAASAVFAGALLALSVADQPPVPAGGEVIGGPYARLLARSVHLGPKRSGTVQVTAALRDRGEPVLLEEWARLHGLSVRWRNGDNWAVIEGDPIALGDAFETVVREYRIEAGADRGKVFYASTEQPAVPPTTGAEVSALGRIFSYTPTRESLSAPLAGSPWDVPDGRLVAGSALPGGHQ